MTISSTSLRSAVPARRHEAEAEAPEPGSGWSDPVSRRAGEAGGGGGWRAAAVGQQNPVHADLRGLLCGAGERLEIPVPLPEPRRRWAETQHLLLKKENGNRYKDEKEKWEKLQLHKQSLLVMIYSFMTEKCKQEKI